MGRSVLFTLIFALIGFIASSAAPAGETMTAPPDDPDPGARYLFYLHGRFVEDRGTGEEYRYDAIVEALADKGFVVISEARPPVRMKPYATKLARQLRSLLRAGVPPRNITVAGHSKGGVLSLLASAIIPARHVRYAILAACGRPNSSFSQPYRRLIDRVGERIKGRFLIMWEQGDRDAGDCDELMKVAGVPYRNLELTVGGGHRLFYEPEASWIDRLVAFARRETD